MGDLACVAACTLVRAANAASISAAERSSLTLNRAVVIDPFCGQGTALVVANEMGMDAIGVEQSRERCRTALTMRVLSPNDDDAPGLHVCS